MTRIIMIVCLHFWLCIPHHIVYSYVCAAKKALPRLSLFEPSGSAYVVVVVTSVVRAALHLHQLSSSSPYTP